MFFVSSLGYAIDIFEPITDPAGVVFRLVLALVAGALVGLERESHAKPAGLRTYIIICLGACLLMLLSIYIPQAIGTGDPGRIAAQVVTGIGFLGAGAIIRFGFNVKGMTSAASIWTMAAVGMAIGAGFYVGAVVSVLILLIALRLLNSVEEKLLGWTLFKKVAVRCSRRADIIDDIVKVFESNNAKRDSWSMRDEIKEGRIEYTAVTKITRDTDVRKILKELGEIDGVFEVRID